MTALVGQTRRTRRQSELLDRLLSLFLAEGFSRFTLDDLAAELRCSKTTLYALAPSKEQLAVEVVKHYFKGATAAVESAVAQEHTDEARIAAYLNEVAHQLRIALDVPVCAHQQRARGREFEQCGIGAGGAENILRQAQPPGREHRQADRHRQPQEGKRGDGISRRLSAHTPRSPRPTRA